jgi:hypothetical protein
MDSTNVVASAAQLYWCVLLKVLALDPPDSRIRFYASDVIEDRYPRCHCHLELQASV